MNKKAPDFITIDPEKQEAELVALFEKRLDKPLYPAQLERLLIAGMAYYANLERNRFNEAARLNLPQFSRYPFLDYLGELVGCKRLQPAKGKSILQIELYEPLNYDLFIDKGLEVISVDEKKNFVSIEGVVIPTGSTITTVEIEAVETGEDANIYSIGEIKQLVKPFSYIKSVRNIVNVSGGADEETDENFAKRIMLAPESFTCAGSRMAYIYHALSAHQSIVDVQAESPILPLTLKKNDTTTTAENGVISNEDYSLNVNYTMGKIVLNHIEQDESVTVYEITLPPPSTVLIYPLTEYGVLPNAVKEAVENKMNSEDILPMTDFVQVIAPAKINVTLPLNVVVKSDADLEMVTAQINEEVENMKNIYKRQLKAELLPSKIITKICNIEGVYDCSVPDFAARYAKANEFFDIVANLSITQQ